MYIISLLTSMEVGDSGPGGQGEILKCRLFFEAYITHQHGWGDGRPGGQGEAEEDGDGQEGGEGVAQVHDQRAHGACWEILTITTTINP